MHFPSRIMKRMVVVPEKMKKKNCYKVTDFFLLVMSLEKKVLKKCYITLIYLSGEYRLNQSKVTCLKYARRKINVLIYFKGTVYLNIY